MLQKTPLRTQTLIVPCCNMSHKAHPKHPRMLRNAHPRFAGNVLLSLAGILACRGGFLGIAQPRAGQKNPLLLLSSHSKHEGNSNSTLLGVAGRHPKGFCSLGGVFQRSFQRICRPGVYYTGWIIHRERNGSLKWDLILASPPANVGDAWHAPGMPAAKR